MITVVHGSDVHFGAPHLPEVAGVFAEEIRAHDPDVLVISGDLTQRAKTHEYEAAAAWLKQFEDLPVVVTPGNHDVPLYRAFERLLDPYRNWRRWIAEDLDSVTRIEGMTIVALNSAAPHTAIVNGRIGARQLDYARDAFRAAPAGDVKMLVTHHNLVPPPDSRGGPTLPGSARLLGAFEEMGVDLVLGGHLHRAYVGTSVDYVQASEPRRAVRTIQSGTTTSSRGRARETGRNSYNLLRIGEDRIEVIPHLFEPAESRFRPTRVLRLPSRSSAEVPLDGILGELDLGLPR